MKKYNFYTILLLLIFSACSLTTDPVSVEVDEQSNPHSNVQSPVSNDSLVLFWNSTFTPKLIEFFNFSDSLLYQFQGSDQRIQKINDSTWSVGIGNLIPRTNYKWRVTVENNNQHFQGPIWQFAFLPGGITEGRILKYLGKEIILPHQVNIDFQVVDLYQKGDGSLIKTDFNLTDDGMSLTDNETIWSINKIDPDFYSKIILLLDVSKSINSSQLADMKTVVVKSVDSFMPNVPDNTKKIEVYKFSDQMIKIVDLTSDKNSIIPVVNALTEGVETTDLYGSVIEITEKFEDIISSDDVINTLILVFTDGSDTQGRRTLNDASKAVGGRNVHTVKTGYTDDYDYYLNRLSSSNNFIENSDSVVTKTLDDFHSNTTNNAGSLYRLIYQSPRRGDFSHELKLLLTGGYYLGPGSLIKVDYSSNGFY